MTVLFHEIIRPIFVDKCFNVLIINNKKDKQIDKNLSQAKKYNMIRETLVNVMSKL